MRNVEERSNELTDPNSLQSRFQRGEVQEDIHYSARQGVKPSDAAKDVWEQAQRDKAAHDKRAAEIREAKALQQRAVSLGISVDELKKRDAEAEKSKAPQSGPSFTGSKPVSGLGQGVDPKDKPKEEPKSSPLNVTDKK